MKKYLKTHISTVLTRFEPQLNYGLKSKPLGTHLKEYFKQNKRLNQDEKTLITSHTYQLMREKMYLEKIYGQKQKDWLRLIYFYFSKEFKNNKKNKSIPEEVKNSCPEFLFRHLKQQYGMKRALKYSEVSITAAPLTIRNNPLKISRQDLHDLLYKNHKLRFINGRASQYALILNKDCKVNKSLYELQEFQQGLFEIQDEGSQMAALQVGCGAGETVMDYCAGSGGKSLLYANMMQNTGKLYLHDISENQLMRAKQRLRRAGVQNAQVVKDISKLKDRSVDWLVLDVPCSGTGVLRRHPDTKYKLNQQELDELVLLQRQIIDDSIRLLKKDGRLVYITCSLLEQENIEQVKYIMHKYGMQLNSNNYFQTFPQMHGMDSLFVANLFYF